MSLSPAPQTMPGPQHDWVRLPLCLALPALIGSLYAWAVLVSTFVQPGWIGLNHIAPGTDWMVFYGAIRSALSGHLSLIMNGNDFTAYLNHTFADRLSVPLQFRPWFYPPSFLVLLLPFAPLGFIGSYVAFQIATFGLLAAALNRSAEPASRLVIAAVVASPAASLNIVDGQCAFLVAGLIVAGVRLLDERPILAGVILGLLSFKPQFFLLVPVALLALNQWRSLLAAAASVLALAAISAAIFGLEIWYWWVPQAVDNLLSPDPKWVNFGRIWGHSVWTCAVLLGAPNRLASLLQIVAVAASALAVFMAFRSALPTDKKLAVLLAAAVLAAPHSGPYDATLLAVATALWLAGEIKAPRPLHWLLGLGIWMVPLLSPPVYIVAGRFAPVLTVAMIALILSERQQLLSAPSAAPRTAAPSCR